MSNTLTISAPGKIILHGEHAVVHGTSALVVSLDLRTSLSITELTTECLSIKLPGIHFEGELDMLSISQFATSLSLMMETMDMPPSVVPVDTTTLLTNLMKKCKSNDFIDGNNHISNTQSMALNALICLYCYISHCGDSNAKMLFGRGFHIESTSQVPIGAGLGSSAAFSVCLSAALLAKAGLIDNVNDESSLSTINRWAFFAEKIIHGNPSGIDNTISVYGGMLSFRLGIMNRLSLRWKDGMNLLLVNTRMPRSTRDLVASVGERLKIEPDFMQSLFDDIERITKECVHCLCYEERDSKFDVDDSEVMTAEEETILLRTLGSLVDENQHLLDTMGVGHTSISRACQIAAEYGLHLKLTGAGGGGCCFAFLPSEQTVILSAVSSMQAAGFECFVTKVAGKGVTMETH